jgi:raffinose/stachyose/melibiose transport system substrate-binding protein
MAVHVESVERPHRHRRTKLAAMTMAAATALVGVAAVSASAAAKGSRSADDVTIGVGTAPVTLNLEEWSGSETTMFQKFAAAFHAQHPNVTVKVTGVSNTTLNATVLEVLSSSDAPDLVRLGGIGETVKDHLLTNLDPYAKAYGWNKWSQTQFASTRVAANGTERGTGSLWAAGPGFSLTGIYYNKALAKRIGMKTPPTTLAQFEQLLAKAKAMGQTPLMVPGKDGTVSFPLENLQVDYAGSTAPIQAWNYLKPGATINSKATVQAATTLQQWAKDGYLPSDINSLDYPTAISQFLAGKAVFAVGGNWSAAQIDGSARGKMGFFLFPPLKANGATGSMSASDTQVIPATAKNKDVAAAFLNWLQTNPKARQIAVTEGGYAPGGPAGASVPKAAAGSALAQTLAAFRTALKKNQLVEYLANATSSIYGSSITPESQLLVAQKTSPSDYAAAIQKAYESETKKS